MKTGVKILLPLLTFALYFFALQSIKPAEVYATSGCCSYHGGVNCSAGAQINGRVICNDGWTGSSCSYSSMAMCSGYSSYSQPTCPLFSSYNSLSGQCECYSGYVASGGQCISRDQSCHNQLGYSSRYNSLSGNCECSYGYIISGSKCVSGTTYCSNKYGAFSQFDNLNNSCKCAYGYVFNSAGNKCISQDEACSDQYGYGAKASLSGDTCECRTGYEWSGGKCVLTTYTNSNNSYIQTNTTVNSVQTPPKSPSSAYVIDSNSTPDPTATPQIETSNNSQSDTSGGDALAVILGTTVTSGLIYFGRRLR